ncbi:hypothetical protein [Neobacillus citreus]|uniref:Uncharacterized protein n=1 Tax=Neobacillus citreus TaxID=2833578 RepID=A0A942Y8L8_9BACI|nr:hypothetical protein [Neobacillus citreus]MCH6265878.1 hypothetical protein [Neobacillus citreus]
MERIKFIFTRIGVMVTSGVLILFGSFFFLVTLNIITVIYPSEGIHGLGAAVPNGISATIGVLLYNKRTSKNLRCTHITLMVFAILLDSFTFLTHKKLLLSIRLVYW